MTVALFALKVTLSMKNREGCVNMNRASTLSKKGFEFDRNAAAPPIAVTKRDMLAGTEPLYCAIAEHATILTSVRVTESRELMYNEPPTEFIEISVGMLLELVNCLISKKSTFCAISRFVKDPWSLTFDSETCATATMDSDPPNAYIWTKTTVALTGRFCKRKAELPGRVLGQALTMIDDE